VVAAEEPSRRLGRVAGIRVLGQQDEQPAAELLMERGEEERQHRLRDARLRRQCPDEGLEAVVAPQLVDECSERRCERGCGRLVHAVRRGSRPAGSSYWPPGVRRPRPEAAHHSRDQPPPGAPPVP
jgi:hypothetical protein